MNELANTERTGARSTLDSLAMQAQMFAQNACMNLLQLGRVLTDARPLVPHGEFDQWCRQNAKMSRRTAEQYMQAYAEFGLNTRIAELGTSKIIKLLPMPPEEREKLLAEKDVSAMTTRELDQAIREQKAKLLKEAQAEARAKAKEEIDRLAETGNALMAEKQRLLQENNSLRRDLKEQREDMEAMQADYNRVQEDLLSLQSAQARGDAERAPAETLTADMFTQAVNTFIGACCTMPQMGRTFSAMPAAEKEAYERSMRTLEKWAEGARAALNRIEGEAIFVE